jgi:uncharacterized membrane protein YhaH (DUF805 family)
MRGQIIGFDPSTNTGAIIGNDGTRYDFVRIDWRSERAPRPRDEVDFSIDGTRACQIFLVQAATGPNNGDRSIGWLWLAIEGRATRYDFWVRYFLIAFVLTFVAALLDQGMSTRYRPQFVFQAITSLVLLWPGIAVQVKRLHDRDMSGLHILWLALLQIACAIIIFSVVRDDIRYAPKGIFIILLFPLGYALFLFVHLGFLRGTRGANKYGEDPLG